MDTSFIVAIVGILGIVLSVSLTYIFSRKVEASKQFKALQVQAYVDFIKGWAGVAQAQRFKDKQREIEYTILVMDAKTRIAIYGSEQIARKLGHFITHYSETISKEGFDAYRDLVYSIRQETFDSRDSISATEISNMLASSESINSMK